MPISLLFLFEVVLERGFRDGQDLAEWLMRPHCGGLESGEGKSVSGWRLEVDRGIVLSSGMADVKCM